MNAPLHRSRQRGMSLLEAMIATLVLSFGVVGLMMAQLTAASQNAAAGKLARATLVARDMSSRIASWPVNDPRIADSNGANNAVTLTSGYVDSVNPADYDSEPAPTTSSSFAAGGLIPNSRLDYNRDGTSDFRRFISVSPLTDAAGVTVGSRIGIVVVWQEGARARRLVIQQAKYDNAGALQGL